MPEIDVYQCETNSYKRMEVLGLLRYVGKDFLLALTGGKVYACVGVENGYLLRIVCDDADEDYLFYVHKARGFFTPLEEGGYWEVVEIYSDELSKVIESHGDDKCIESLRVYENKKRINGKVK